VDQCNAAINGGGGTLRCSVKVTNNFVGRSPGSAAATVNQCVGSGDGIANECDPFPANTTNATITQCNGSANGGTLVQLKCTARGTKPSSNGVRINQCNGSANGGGALVICSTDLSNHRIAAAAATSSGSSSGSTPTGPPTDVAVATDPTPAGPTPLLFVGLGLLAIAFVGRRPSRTSIR
jgi:MYXO-CTERM domain-containing protein